MAGVQEEPNAAAASNSTVLPVKFYPKLKTRKKVPVQQSANHIVSFLNTHDYTTFSSFLLILKDFHAGVEQFYLIMAAGSF